MADGCWKDYQQMPGCSKDLVDFATSGRKMHQYWGGGEDADPTLILRSMEFGRVIAEIHLREKVEGSVNEEVEDAVHGR